MHLLVVLQTHALGDSQAWLNKPRYCGAPKSEVTRRCVLSLIRSLNHACLANKDLSVDLMVFDDHSDAGSLRDLRSTLDRAEFAATLQPLASRGIMPSILACYRYGIAQGREWVYFAQDDYLYEPCALTHMTHLAPLFSANLGAPASLYPFNDPARYLPHNVGEKVHIVRGLDRHWRTNYHTASCFMTHHQVLKANWDLFHRFATSELSATMEDDSINQLFISRGYQLFTPIPSLALHLQYDTEEDPLLDWRPLWAASAQL